MKIAFVGSRNWPAEKIDYIVFKLSRLLLEAFGVVEDVTIISGGAAGVDTWSIVEAKKIGFPTQIFPADWNRYGKSAGYIRNEEMVKAADGVIAFWDGRSRGTKHSIDLALQHKKHLEVFFP